MDHTPIEHLFAGLFPPAPPDGGPAPALYTVLDGARDARIYRAVYESRLDHECLFSGDISHDLAEAAPYLVHLTQEAAFTRWLLEQGWGQSFGIFAWTRADTETLRRHLRRLLEVRNEEGKKLYFRYYDPRVLRLYLPTCTAEERRAVFGPMGRLLMEGDLGQVLCFEPTGRLTALPPPKG